MKEALLHLSAGKGPEECRWVVAQLAKAYVREAAEAELACDLLEDVSGNPASLFLRLSGPDVGQFAAARTGTVLWVGASPFRLHHKRRNWFAGVALVPAIEEVADLRDEDIVYHAMRASGPGGQHVNKTDSAVRAVHQPTGLVTVVQDQRSQHANRKLARLKLALLLAEQREAGLQSDRLDAWSRNQELERGNPVRIYEGPRFRLRSHP
jgi:peptide chain release factor